MRLRFRSHFQPTLQHLNRYDALGNMLRHSSAAIKQEQRDSKAPVPVKRLLSMLAGRRQLLRQQRRRKFFQIDMELRRMKPIFRMLSQTFVLFAHYLFPIR